MTGGYRLGVDIGGTFTDAILWDDRDGMARTAKVPSTPTDPSIGFRRVVQRILDESGLAPAALPIIVHGTTVATNAIIEGKTARTAFVTTQGFRDMLEIARQTRPSLYDLQFQKPRPLVPRHLCFEVPERLDARGNVLVPLAEDASRDVARLLAAERVTSIGVCLLHSYLNAAHERRLGELLRAALPGVSISLSCDVAPECREYYRASTTLINAAIQPIVRTYLEAITRNLAAQGFAAELLIMQSNGGVMTAHSASEQPVFMVESGPAAGVTAAAYLAEQLGYREVISFDMGGTTAKLGLVHDGRPTVTKEYEVGAQGIDGTGAARGRGYPIRTPVIDLVEIGAGGGSIAWVDDGGVLRVGPRSAGADPGPACYGRGGREPTITDAQLVLGRINPANFLGGALGLDVEAARKAITSKCAEPLGIDMVVVARGIIEIANAAMTNAMHLVSVQRGHDPREFALVAFGGAGPLHANRLAATLRIPLTVIPRSPGTTSAMGLLATDYTHEFPQTLRRRTGGLQAAEIEQAFGALEARGRQRLQRDGLQPEQTSYHRLLEMRYVGQSYEITIPAPDSTAGDGWALAAAQAFHAEHARLYGFSAPDEPTEIISIRVTAVGRMARPHLGRHAPSARGGPSANGQWHTSRLVYFEERGGFVPCAIYERRGLALGDAVVGPAVVEEPDATTVIHPGYAAVVDQFGNMLLRAMTGADGAVSSLDPMWEARADVDGQVLVPITKATPFSGAGV